MLLVYIVDISFILLMFPSFLQTMMSTFIGIDEFGNRYYKKNTFFRSFKRESRFVIYSGLPEASKIPAPWQMWLNHQLIGAPVLKRKKYKWESKHCPNLTGTRSAYSPPGSFGSSNIGPVTGTYEPWRP